MLLVQPSILDGIAATNKGQVLKEMMECDEVIDITRKGVQKIFVSSSEVLQCSFDKYHRKEWMIKKILDKIREAIKVLKVLNSARLVNSDIYTS